jgi:hypothetical protein
VVLPEIVRQLPLLARLEPLDACERESGKTRNLPNGGKQTIEELGERIQNITLGGCRVTTYGAPKAGLRGDLSVGEASSICRSMLTINAPGNGRLVCEIAVGILR